MVFMFTGNFWQILEIIQSIFVWKPVVVYSLPSLYENYQWCWTLFTLKSLRFFFNFLVITALRFRSHVASYWISLLPRLANLFQLDTLWKASREQRKTKWRRNGKMGADRGVWLLWLECATLGGGGHFLRGPTSFPACLQGSVSGSPGRDQGRRLMWAVHSLIINETLLHSTAAILARSHFMAPRLILMLTHAIHYLQVSFT